MYSYVRRRQGLALLSVTERKRTRIQCRRACQLGDTHRTDSFVNHRSGNRNREIFALTSL